jgi:hypothetical protein
MENRSGKKAPREALRAWFLGPRAENADLFERLITEALRDHIFWRRNYIRKMGLRSVRRTSARRATRRPLRH